MGDRVYAAQDVVTLSADTILDHKMVDSMLVMSVTPLILFYVLRRRTAC
jgi:hypothetical protein